jgi:hypothetical protein
MTTEIIQKFFTAFMAAQSNRTVYNSKIPASMMASAVDASGWFEWKLLAGNLQESDYKKVEDRFHILFPKSFIAWHKQYFFLDGDCSFIRLPSSNPVFPLGDIESKLDWVLPKSLITQKLYPFADEGNDTGPYVFDARISVADNEFPIRVYDHGYKEDIEGLSEVVFSSFHKMIECLTHYLSSLQSRKDYEIIPDFFVIDPTGAGDAGRNYWLTWSAMLKENFEEFGD